MNAEPCSMLWPRRAPAQCLSTWPDSSCFPGGVGNTQKDAARFTSLIDDVEDRIFGTLPDQTWVYPGHGKDTTLGAERPHLTEWRERGW
jgi:glyoxylase-like metal-dependent hydrolase (beta-lactamase superfamily II)